MEVVQWRVFSSAAERTTSMVTIYGKRNTKSLDHAITRQETVYPEQEEKGEKVTFACESKWHGQLQAKLTSEEQQDKRAFRTSEAFITGLITQERCSGCQTKH